MTALNGLSENVGLMLIVASSLIYVIRTGTYLVPPRDGLKPPKPIEIVGFLVGAILMLVSFAEWW